MQKHPHLVFLTGGSSGDMYPFMAMAQAMQSQGRKVTVMGTAYYAPIMADLSLPFIPIGTAADFEQGVGNPDIWNPKKGFEALLNGFHRPLLQTCDSLVALSPDEVLTVVAHPLTVPAVALARKTGRRLNLVGACLAPSNLRSCHDPLRFGALPIPRWVPLSWRKALWRLVEAKYIDPVAVHEVNTAREARGMSPITSFLNHIADEPDLWLTLFPSWFATPQPDWPQPVLQGDFPRFDPFETNDLPMELVSFLAAGDPPLVFTPGTGHAHADAYFRAACEAVQQTGRRAIFLTRFREQVPSTLPDSILWLPYVPIARLLPQTAGLVHHGGIGTTAAALHAGVPQLVTPFAWDQFDNGARIAALGVGTVLLAAQISPRRLKGAIDALLSRPSVANACREAAERSKTSLGLTVLCEQMEAALQRGQ